MPIVLKLKNFHSIAAAKISFANPTFLVGCNGSGKSNLADAFAFISEAVTSPLQLAFDRRGGIGAVATRSTAVVTRTGTGVRFQISQPKPVGIAVEISRGADGPEWPFESVKYAFEVDPTSPTDFRVTREQCILLALGGDIHWYDRQGSSVRGNVKFIEAIDNWASDTSLLLPLIGGMKPFYPAHSVLQDMRVYAIDPNALRDAQIPETGLALRADGRNAASVLQELLSSPDIVLRIQEILASVTPGICRVRPVTQGKKLGLEFQQRWGSDERASFDAFNMSDGTLRVFGLLLALFQKPAPSVVVIEEPEATIHPGALGTILECLRNAAKSMQVIVTTHSPDVLDAKWITPENLRIVTWENGATRISEIGQMPREALRQHLMGAGELLRSNALEPADALDEPDTQIELFDELK